MDGPVAGTYAALSFTVSRQTREIGIRIALGAGPRRIVAGVFSKAMLQIGLGIALGAGVWLATMALLVLVLGRLPGRRHVTLALRHHRPD